MLYRESVVDRRFAPKPEMAPGVISRALKLGRTALKRVLPDRVPGTYPVFTGTVEVGTEPYLLEKREARRVDNVTGNLQTRMNDFMAYEEAVIASPWPVDEKERKTQITDTCRSINTFAEAFGIKRTDVYTKTKLAMAVSVWLRAGENPFNDAKPLSPALTPAGLIAMAEERFDPALLDPTTEAWNEMARLSEVETLPAAPELPAPAQSLHLTAA